jgi:hypothetical protein
MGSWAKNKWGILPIALGAALIVAAVAILVIHVTINQELSGSSAAYAQRFDFWFSWAPTVTFLLNAGALITVLGFLALRRVTSKFSYALVAVGFLLISLDSYYLVINWVRGFINIIGWENFYSISAYFFSLLTAGIFLVACGIILGFHARNKWGATLLTGGLTLCFQGLWLLVLDVIITIDIDPVFGLRDFRWYFFWQNFQPLIPFSLIIGGLLVFLGASLIRKDH